MNTIGGISCDIVNGVSNREGERSRKFVRPGVDGFGAQALGKGRATFRFRAIKLDSESNVNSWEASIRALQATVVSIVDSHGETFADCFVQLVDRERKFAAGVPGNMSRKQNELLVFGERKV